MFWFKMHSDKVLHDRRMSKLRRGKGGMAAIGLWVHLYALASEIGENGTVYISETIPYTASELADEFRMDEETAVEALEALQALGLITVDEKGVIYINDWYEEQDQKVRDDNRARKQKQRAAEKERQEIVARLCNGDVTEVSQVCHADVTEVSRQCHGTDIDIDIEKEKELELEVDVEVEKDAPLGAEAEEEKNLALACAEVLQLYNNTTLPKIFSLSQAQKRAIKAAYDRFGAEKLGECFKRAEASAFLSGRKNDDWCADLHWLARPENVENVLNGKYDDYGRSRASPAYITEFNNSSFSGDEFIDAALARGFDDL